MKNMKFWRTALVAALVLTVMLSVTGGTIAWFTDSVTSGNNIIVSGTLDVGMKWVDGKANPAGEDTVWTDASAGAIFTHDLWEPGYVEVRHVMIENKGTLALKYELEIEPTGTVSNLADVIDVYYADPAVQVADRTALTDDKKLSTLADFINQNGTEENSAAGHLAAGAAHTVTIALKMQETAGNEYQGLSIGSDFKLVLRATQDTVETDSFDNQYDAEATYPTGNITADTIDEVDFTEDKKTFVLSGEFGDITIPELGEESVIKFDDATVGKLSISDDAVLTGSASIDSLEMIRNGETPIEAIITDADFDIAGNVNVKNTLGKSVLNIENSSLECGTLFVGENTSRYGAALAEFNVVNSYLRCYEESLGSTIAVWGRSGVKSTIYDSEIHTYSRGWHQSEDANDNGITFQGATNIDVDIQRSNIHTYGARSIVNARQYGSENTTINTKIDDSLIWVVTKSTHGEETIPVWGFNDITNTALVFTKNVATADQVVDSSFVYGNPVVHGNFNLLSGGGDQGGCNCNWDAHVALDDETVTFAADANVSIDAECPGSLSFVLSESAEVVVEDGASVSGKVNVIPAEGYTLNTVTNNGATTYSVSAN